MFSTQKSVEEEAPDSQGRCCVNVHNVNLWTDTPNASNKSLSVARCTIVTPSAVVTFFILSLFLSLIYSCNTSFILIFSGAGDTSWL